MVARRRLSRRRTGVRRRSGRRVLQDGAIVPARNRARNAAVGFLMGRAANQGMRVANNAIGRLNNYLREARGRRNMARAAKRTAVMGGMRKRGRAGEVSAVKRRYGRYRPSVVTKFTKISVPKRIMRFQNLTNVDMTKSAQTCYGSSSNAVTTTDTGATVFPGSYLMAYLRDTAGAGFADVFPMYMVDLSTTPNSSTGGSVLYGCAMSASGVPIFPPMQGMDATGTLGVTTWQSEMTTCTNASPNARYISPQWYDIRLAMYGARKSQTVFTVEYVQLTADHFSPWSWAGTTFTQQQQRETVRWYQNQFRSYVTSGITPRVTPVTRAGWHVLKRWTYRIKGALTTEVDDTPNSAIAKLFVRDGRIVKYIETTSTALTTDSEVGDINKWRAINTTNDIITDFPTYPRSKRFLIIRANVTDSTAVTLNTGKLTGASVDVHPSFDICVRKKELLVDDAGNTA